jgi:DNA-directed RNA polymerase sigma subunit (sigma70/sigma32)
MDLQRISRLLRRLSPRQEKVMRLYFGLGCERPHAAQELAKEFGVSAQVIAGIVGAAQKRLAQEGLTSRHLREAARQEADLRRSSRLVTESPRQFRHGTHSHHRF